MDNNVKKKLIVASIIVAIILLAGGVFFLVWKGLPSPAPVGTNNVTKVNGNMQDKLGSDAAKETQKLIDEVKKQAESVNNGSVSPDEKISQVVSFTTTETNGTSTVTSTQQAIVVAPSSNPISTKTGEVLTRDGSGEAVNNVQAGNLDAPIQSDVIDPNKLPESTVKIVMSASDVSPKSFTVKANQAVALSVTANGALVIFKFDDPALSSVALGLKPGESRVITFNAPAKPGNYVFYSDYVRSAATEGLMIVQ